ncbi:MAG TPA: carbohydrate kinase family protein [Candidatus Baltobacteraceae bacterium]|nr:carbohydrate kinase family protein [Candidatus Baltobacteraceae bacterium]
MAEVLCIGGACIDRKYHLAAAVQPGTSNPARSVRGFGGVARNVAENLARLGAQTALFTIVGNDEDGSALVEHARQAGIDVRSTVRTRDGVTPEYAAVVDPHGDLLVGVSDMQALDELTVEELEKQAQEIAQSRWVFADCNLPRDVLAWCIGRAQTGRFKLAIDAVSEPKARRLPDDLRGIDVLFLNEPEAAAFLREELEEFRARTPAQRARAVRSRGAHAVVLTRGPQGLAACTDTCVEIPAAAARCVDVTGAGDALIAATIFRLLRGDTVFEAARAGALCAARTIESSASVRPDLCAEMLQACATS